ncbi:MAG: hypothetical protein JXA68_04140 [Ignavibacteriales bacterium]|nr:hypothetical protein [Ignavibacteriales bacterium]
MKDFKWCLILVIFSTGIYSSSITLGPITYTTPVVWEGVDTIKVEGLVTIDDDGELTIEAGVVVYFISDTYIQIQGTEDY